MRSLLLLSFELKRSSSGTFRTKQNDKMQMHKSEVQKQIKSLPLGVLGTILSEI